MNKVPASKNAYAVANLIGLRFSHANKDIRDFGVFLSRHCNISSPFSGVSPLMGHVISSNLAEAIELMQIPLDDHLKATAAILSKYVVFRSQHAKNIIGECTTLLQANSNDNMTIDTLMTQVKVQWQKPHLASIENVHERALCEHLYHYFEIMRLSMSVVVALDATNKLCDALKEKAYPILENI